jgi:GNAT superfamily N-acetyltransferase
LKFFAWHSRRRVFHAGKKRRTADFEKREVRKMRIVSNALQIRSMTEQDYQDVFRMYRQLAGKNIFKNELDFSRIFKSFFDRKDREAYVAALHNRAIGFVTLYYMDVFHRSGQVASIQELVVTEEFRGRGVGQAIIEFVKQRVKERHCRGMEVATDLWQSGAKSFYERCGLKGQTQMMAI